MSVWREQVENDFAKNINDTYTLNLAISILEDRENFREEIERLTAESTEWESKCYKYQDIIKEVREIFKYYGDRGDIVGYSNYFISGEALIKLLEILDKEDKNGNNK